MNVNKMAADFPKHMISTAQLNAAQLANLLELAEQGKPSNWRDFAEALKHKVIGLVFFNPSLRTRASFQAGAARLGASTVVMNATAELWQIEFEDGAVMNADKAEHVREVAKVLGGYFDLVGVRSFAALKSWEEDQQDKVVSKFAKLVRKPVVNLESSMWHPCQALADALTLREKFGADLRGKRFVVSWVNHPRALPTAVPNSALLIAAQLGMDVRLACPKGYELGEQVIESARGSCAENGAKFEISNIQEQAVADADVIYAKSWTPPHLVGREAQDMEARKNLSDWIIDKRLMRSKKAPYFMHCLPARRNVVVSDEVIDGPTSLVEQQAENRMHAQNALLLKMLGVY